MNDNSFLYWLLIEESRFNTAFEGSLQSKMSKNNIYNGIMNGLNARKNYTNIDAMKGASAVLTEEIKKENILGNFSSYLFPQFKCYVLYKVGGVG